MKFYFLMSEIKTVSKQFSKTYSRSLFEYFTLKTNPYSDSSSGEHEKVGTETGDFYFILLYLQFRIFIHIRSGFLMLYKYSNEFSI